MGVYGGARNGVKAEKAALQVGSDRWCRGMAPRR